MTHVCKILTCFHLDFTNKWTFFLIKNVIFRLPDGSLMEITKVYPLDAVFDNPEDVPEDVM